MTEKYLKFPYLFILFFILYPVNAFSGLIDFLERVEQTEIIDFKNLLDEFDIVLFDKSSGEVPKYCISAGIINAPPEKVFSTVIDYENYTNFVPGATKSKVLEQTKDTITYKRTTALDFSIISKKLDYTQIATLKRPTEVNATLVEGDMDKFDNIWKLIPVNDGSRTIVLYAVEFDYKSIGGIARWVMKKEPLLEVGLSISVPMIDLRAMRNYLTNNKEESSALIDQKTFIKHIEDIDKSSLRTISEKSDIIMFEKSGENVPKLSAAITLIESSPEDIFSVIESYEEYPNFMPTVSKIDILEKKDNLIQYRQQLKIDLIIFNYYVDYTLNAFHFPPLSIDSELVEGDLDKVNVAWRLFPDESGKRTVTAYFADVNYKSLSAIVRWGLKRQPQLEVVFTGATPIVINRAIQKKVYDNKNNIKSNKGL